MINVENITKYYGDFRAVNDISFAIRDGEITGLLGPNGAGKTTTLRMLTCFLKQNEGVITVGGVKTDEDPLKVKKMIGYLPESAPIYPDMLVYDYLKYISDLRGIEKLNRIEEMGELCGITDVMHKSVHELSKGYKQRVGLAHAMIHDPEILILDEPTSGLDPNQIIEIRNLIKELGKRKTVILSTHILPEVEATCDRVIIINRGSIVADDRTENLQVSGDQKSVISLKLSGGDYSSLEESLKGLSGISGVERQDEDNITGVRITGDGTRDLRPEIYGIIKNSDWVIYEMQQEQESLENIFRELTVGGDYE